MDKTASINALTQAGLERVAPDLDKLLRPSIRLRAQATGESAIPAGGSKLGGQPDLPSGMAWPTGKGAPLAFIAQIRLDELHALPTAQPLPSAGLLSFFYDASQQTFGEDPADRGGWQVLLQTDLARLTRTPLPAEVARQASYTACTLTASEEWTLPQQPELDLPQLDWTPQEKTAYESALATFPSQADRATMHHRMLGYADTIQDDMRVQCALYANGVTSADDPRAAQLEQTANNWQLLLQVDSDAQAGMRWASSGMLYFWIEAAALQAGKFDRVWVVLQSE